MNTYPSISLWISSHLVSSEIFPFFRFLKRVVPSSLWEVGGEGGGWIWISVKVKRILARCRIRIDWLCYAENKWMNEGIIFWWLGLRNGVSWSRIGRMREWQAGRYDIDNKNKNKNKNHVSISRSRRSDYINLYIHAYTHVYTYIHTYMPERTRRDPIYSHSIIHYAHHTIRDGIFFGIFSTI